MAVNRDDQALQWFRDTEPEYSQWLQNHSMRIGTVEQHAFRLRDYWIDPRQPTEHLDWGFLHLSVAPPAAAAADAVYNVSSWMGDCNYARTSFAATGAVPRLAAAAGGTDHDDDLAMPEPACGNTTTGYFICTCAPGMRGGPDQRTEDAIPRGDLWPGLSASVHLGRLGSRSRRAVFVTAVDDLGLSVRFFGTPLGEVWRHQNAAGKVRN